MNKSKETKQIEIYKNWDSFPSPTPDGVKSLYALRPQVDMLARWIVNSEGGNVLVSGIRGVRKTAFVYFSISRAFFLRKYKWLFKFYYFLKKYSFLVYIPKYLIIIGKIRNIEFSRQSNN